MLSSSDLQQLKAGFAGDLFTSADAEYDTARRVWNGTIDRRPAVIARCTSANDVIHALSFARSKNLEAALRAGGHSIAGKSVCDDGMVIDVSPMKACRIDPERRIAHAEAGLTWGEFDKECQVHGLGTTGGVISTTGIAGLTLGGGIGWLMGKHGLSCDNLLSVEIVTADGQLLTASPDQNPRLFWAVRGGGGNFGVVTSFEYQLHPVDSIIGGMVLHPAAKAREVLHFYRDFTATSPDEITAYAGIVTGPDGSLLTALICGYSGPQEAGEAVVKPLHVFGPPIVDHLGPLPYAALQSMLDFTAPYGAPSYLTASFVKQLTDEMLDTFIAHGQRKPTPQCAALLEQFHGAASRVPSDATAFGLRTVQYSVNIIAIWQDPSQAAACLSWAREFSAAIQPFTDGTVYMNYLGDEGDQRIKSAYGANYARLAAVKAEYDPDNVFHLNQNIRPRAEAQHAVD